MKYQRIKPRQGLIVRDPETYEPLPPEGTEKPMSGYWLRRLKENDCILVPTKKDK